ncbi:unnamed protein product [Ilex paraguariensis]|uniref:Uncharacterized protein n=1 Tax=Ilex paraguariensis TaxID=185542 RepID=A0ABC8REU6_9AQUA
MCWAAPLEVRVGQEAAEHVMDNTLVVTQLLEVPQGSWAMTVTRWAVLMACQAAPSSGGGHFSGADGSLGSWGDGFDSERRNEVLGGTIKRKGVLGGTQCAMFA